MSLSICHVFQGGVKVLITGPWQEASSNYSCLFDQISVPASLIQPGVLRCYCPGKTGESLLVLKESRNGEGAVIYDSCTIYFFIFLGVDADLCVD